LATSKNINRGQHKCKIIRPFAEKYNNSGHLMPIITKTSEVKIVLV